MVTRRDGDATQLHVDQSPAGRELDDGVVAEELFDDRPRRSAGHHVGHTRARAGSRPGQQRGDDVRAHHDQRIEAADDQQSGGGQRLGRTDLTGVMTGRQPSERSVRIARPIQLLGAPGEQLVHRFRGRPELVRVGERIEVDRHLASPAGEVLQIGGGKAEEPVEGGGRQWLGQLGDEIDLLPRVERLLHPADPLVDQRPQPAPDPLQRVRTEGRRDGSAQPLVLRRIGGQHRRWQGSGACPQQLPLGGREPRIGQHRPAVPVPGDEPGPGGGDVVDRVAGPQCRVRRIGVGPDRRGSRVEGGRHRSGPADQCIVRPPSTVST